MTKTKASKAKASDQIASTTGAPTSKLSVANLQRPPDKAAASRTAAAPKPGKIDKIIAMMRRPKGASISDLTRATAWQAAFGARVPYRGRFARNRGSNVVSEKSGDVRLYRIAGKAVWLDRAQVERIVGRRAQGARRPWHG